MSSSWFESIWWKFGMQPLPRDRSSRDRIKSCWGLMLNTALQKNGCSGSRMVLNVKDAATELSNSPDLSPLSSLAKAEIFPMWAVMSALNEAYIEWYEFRVSVILAEMLVSNLKVGFQNNSIRAKMIFFAETKITKRQWARHERNYRN